MTTRPPSFTGRARRRQTRWTVRVGDAVARLFISIGGIGTIVAVLGVFVFLVWQVVPLFLPASVSDRRRFDAPEGAVRPVGLAADEYQVMGWALYGDGTLDAFALADGRLLERQALFADGARITAAGAIIGSDEVVLGFADGTVRTGRLGFASSFLAEQDAAAELRALEEGRSAVFERGIVQRTSAGQLRHQVVRAALDEPMQVSPGAAVTLVDAASFSNRRLIAALSDDGVLRLVSLRAGGLLARQPVRSDAILPFEPAGREPPLRLLVTGFGDNVMVAWADGTLQRYDTRDLQAPHLAETIDLVPEEGQRLTALEFLIGRSTLLAGDSLGRIRAWFRVRPEEAATPDGLALAAAHELAGPPAAVTALAASARGRMLAAGYADGSARVFQVTSRKQLADLHAGDQPVQAVLITPKDDGLLALAAGQLWHWSFDPRHPETTLRSLFGRVWYEGYNQPEHIWQSSAGTDDFEPKLGLMPLVFGTFKATFYSLIFGVPIALLAAIYTSEFLHPRARTLIKPAVEMMAGLPSVVLGFLAALMIAPVVDSVVPAMLLLPLAVPLTFLLGAYLWQLLPGYLALRWGRLRLVLMLGLLPLGVLAALALGPAVEQLLFGGNLKLWLDWSWRYDPADLPIARRLGAEALASWAATAPPGDPRLGYAPADLEAAQRFAGASGGWMILAVPLAALATAAAMARWVNPALRAATASLGRAANAVVDLLKFLAGAVVALGAALAASAALSALGLDPRGTYVDTYVPRNALIVGFVMGFAIIPIIYTIADDALSTVPDHLRAASLGAGATRWQTAVRIVIPTAMSGLFSAVMIGVGRAVGETMIVLMAAGNTPVMSMNMFEGFRTLSANIAVELPEAVKGSTHYRTLFLAALTLFVMTFILNTVAEAVRIRFRRRAYQL